MKKKLITGLLCLACLIPPSFGDGTTPIIFFDDTTSTYGIKDEKGNLLSEMVYDGIDEFKEGLAIIQKNGQFGVLSQTGVEVVAPNYKYITSYRNGYATVFKDQYAGVFNTSGDLVIPIEYDNVSHVVNGNALAYKNNKLGLVSVSNEIIHPFVWDQATMLDFNKDFTSFVFKQGSSYGIGSYTGEILLAPQEKELYHISVNQVAFVDANKIGVMAHNGDLLIPANYDSIYIAGNGFMGRQGDAYYFFDLDNKLSSKAYDRVSDIDGRHYLVTLNNKQGIYDAKTHKELLKADYDAIELLQNPHDMTKKYFQLTRNSVVEDDLAFKGVATLEGRELLPTLYKSISFLTPDIMVYENSQGLIGTYNTTLNTNSKLSYTALNYNPDTAIGIVASKDKHYGLIDANGSLILDMDNDSIYENGNFYIAEKDEKKALFHKTKKSLSPYKYDTIFSFRNIGKTDAAIISINNHWGLLTSLGTYLVAPEYDAITEFVNGYAIVSKNGLYGFIDTKGDLIIKPQYEDVSSFSNGLAIAQKGNYYGFLQANGRFLIPPIFDHVKPFDDAGHAVVTLKGRKGILNKNGTYFLKAVYKELIFVDNKIIIVQESATNKYGILKTTGEEIAPPIYDEIGAFFKSATSYAKLNDKYALINNEGNLLTEFLFDEFSLFNNGFAKVRIKDRHGFINSRGDYILE